MGIKTNISIVITKLLFSISILQLLLICLLIIPPTDVESSVFVTSLRSYIPEMTEEAIFMAILSYPAGLIFGKILKK